MADGTVGVLQAGSPDRLIDNEVIGSAYRQRVRLGGLTLAALADVLNSTPAGTEYALLVRPIPSGTQTVSGAVTAGQAASVTAAWTSATGANTTVSLTVTNYGSVSASLNTSGTVTGGVVTFEASDDAGTTWYAIAFARAESFTVDTTYTVTGGNRLWSSSADALTNIRVRLSSVVVGSGTVNVRLTPIAMGLEPMATIGGTVTANPSQPATGTVTNFAAAVTNATLKASNAARKGLLIYNNSTAATMFVKFAATATTADFTTKVPPGGYYELPQPVYTGIVDCIWDIASGSAQVTEMT